MSMCGRSLQVQGAVDQQVQLVRKREYSSTKGPGVDGKKRTELHAYTDTANRPRHPDHQASGDTGEEGGGGGGGGNSRAPHLLSQY